MRRILYRNIVDSLIDNDMYDQLPVATKIFDKLLQKYPEYFNEKFFAYAPCVLVNSDGVISDTNPENSDKKQKIIMIAKYPLKAEISFELLKDLKYLYGANYADELSEIVVREIHETVSQILATLKNDQIICWHTPIGFSPFTDKLPGFSMFMRFGIYTPYE